MQRGEREAAVEKIEGKRKPDDFFGHRNRTPAPHSHPDFDRVRVRFFFLIFDELPQIRVLKNIFGIFLSHSIDSIWHLLFAERFPFNPFTY